MKKIITHSGKFHADDVFAVASLELLFGEENIEIIRTRDEEIIKTGDIVLDVGGIYEENSGRLDHHQPEGAGKRENGVPYSSLGLVWKRYGEELCGSKKVADYLDRRFVTPIDAVDNGFNIAKPLIGVPLYSISDMIYAWTPNWNEGKDYDEAFKEVLQIAKKVLGKEISKAQAKFEAEPKVREIYENTEDKSILILDDDYPWLETVAEFPETLFVISPKNDTWHANAVRSDLLDFKSRKSFPNSWSGKRNEELQELSGVKDAIFCHRNLFLCVAKSKEGALKLAKIALET